MIPKAIDNGWMEADRRNAPWLATVLDAAHRRALLMRWRQLQGGQDGAMYVRSGISLSLAEPPKQTVILSGGYRGDQQWLHVSTAWTNRLPTWEEFREVRETFFGDDLVAIQVFPPKAEYVNVHRFCLHLYARVDERTVPDLRIGGTI